MSWSIDDSKIIHGIGSGDLDFLDINQNGQLVVKFNGHEISVKEILDMLCDDFNLKPNQRIPSFTLRLPQLIGKQIDRILRAFDNAISEYDYTGEFDPLYPIKVNQQKSEITSVLKSSPRYGLEAGTKAELFLILKQLNDQKNRLIVCNGVKDREYIEIINQAIVDDYSIFVSIESVEELRLCMSKIAIDKLNLIFRIKPYVPIEGYWGATSGRNSKFGLSINDLIEVMDILEETNHRDLLQGIHAHPGSQISDFHSLTKYINFLVNTFHQLYARGFNNLKIINFGGGLPIRYESENNVSLVDQYAKQVIHSITNMCRDHSIPQPNIMIESGRYITASSSMTIIQILDFMKLFPSKEKIAVNIKKQVDNITSIEEAEKLWKQHEDENYKNYDFSTLYEYEAEHGAMKQALRAQLGVLFHDKVINNEVLKPIYKSDYIILGNFSVFNSVCDHVMVGQYFPVFEIENLDHQPDTIIRLVDITCDSDGELSRFRLKKHSTELMTKDGFPLTSNEKHYFKGFPISFNSDPKSKYIAVPLAGAYQDIIELDHNLIGDLPDVKIELQSDGAWNVEVTTHAQPIQDILKRVGYHLEIDRSSYIN